MSARSAPPGPQDSFRREPHAARADSPGALAQELVGETDPKPGATSEVGVCGSTACVSARLAPRPIPTEAEPADADMMQPADFLVAHSAIPSMVRLALLSAMC